MALDQKRRTKTIHTEQKNATWSSVFPESLKTEQKSLLFVKKLVTVGISTITYLRGVFPEDAYGDKCCEGLNLKILLDDETCPEVSTLIKWIKGSFDAIQKKYLRQMTFALSSSNDPDEPALETYTFRFGYSDGLATVESITSSAKKGSNSECDVVRKIKRPTLKMLRTIILLTESLTDVPRNAFLSMRLLYYDDDTPEDYHPEGFTSGNLENYVFENKPTLMKVGAVNTGLHSLKLKIHTSYGFTSEDSDKQQTNESSADSAAELRQSSNEQRESREQPSTVGSNCSAIDHLLDDSADHLSQRIEETSLLADDKENTIRRYSGSRSITRLPKILSPNDKSEPLLPDPSPKYQEIETMSFTFSDKSLPATAACRPTFLDMASSVACNRNAFSAELQTDGSETPLLCPALGNSLLVRTLRANSGMSGCSQVSVRSVSVYLAPNSPSKEYPVRCPCEVEADDGLMIQCDVCGYWQHGGCFSVLEEHRVPDRHICQLCSDDTFLCTDARLCTLSADQLSLTCLLRRTLLLLRTRDTEHNNNQQHMVTTSSVILAKRLGVTIAKAGTIITTLDEMGLIATKTNSGFCKVDGEKLESIIPMYFSASKSQTPSVASVSDVPLESQEWTVQPPTKRQKVSISCPMDGAAN